MSAEVETIFYTGEKPWHGLRTRVEDMPDSKEALELAGPDRQVTQRPTATTDGQVISGFKANIRNADSRVLEAVTDRYKVVQNEDAFAFTDRPLGGDATYEAAGLLRGGRCTWLLAKLPQRYIMSRGETMPYMVFVNTHDRAGAIRVAMTPVRVTCVNTLNLALSTTKRSWSTSHTGDIAGEMEDIRYALLYAGRHTSELGRAMNHVKCPKFLGRQAMEYIDALFPLYDNPTPQQQKNLDRMKEDVKTRYLDASDLKHVRKNGCRLVNAVSNFATYARSLRESANHRENLLAKTVEGNTLIDRTLITLQAA